MRVGVESLRKTHGNLKIILNVPTASVIVAKIGDRLTTDYENTLKF